ncbi:uncharacterized protein LOC141693500 [Apium graveolens]|uniref:uncharacterized protein LOC141693500 n=1 Tax=Apium graveolens TaxID=4045 RepID=UPI003D7A7804
MHLYNNMHKEHKGLGLRGILWSAARSTTSFHFERNMDTVKKLSKNCWEWLNDKPKEQWSRSGFKTTCKSDIFVNNHCEVFNASIRKVRHLPIIAMLRCIHLAVMSRIQRRMAEAQTWEQEFCPNPLKRLEEAKKKSVACHVTWSGGPRYLVQTSAGGYELVVDIVYRTCACNKWQLTGIPCFHAVACLNSHGFNLHDYIHRCYSVNMFKKVYSHFVEPINGKEQWERTAYTKPLPPIVKPSTGRPKVRRNKKNDIPIAPDATSLKRRRTSVQCGNCNVWGHNRRTCPSKNNESTIEGNATEGNENVTNANQTVEGNENVTNENANQNTEDEEVAREPEEGGENFASEFMHGASQPTHEMDESQGGVFSPQSPTTNPLLGTTGVTLKAWQKQHKAVTTRAEIMRARSTRERKMNKKYAD